MWICALYYPDNTCKYLGLLMWYAEQQTYSHMVCYCKIYAWPAHFWYYYEYIVIWYILEFVLHFCTLGIAIVCTYAKQIQTTNKWDVRHQVIQWTRPVGEQNSTTFSGGASYGEMFSCLSGCWRRIWFNTWSSSGLIHSAGTFRSILEKRNTRHRILKGSIIVLSSNSSLHCLETSVRFCAFLKSQEKYAFNYL